MHISQASRRQRQFALLGAVEEARVQAGILVDRDRTIAAVARGYEA